MVNVPQELLVKMHMFFKLVQMPIQAYSSAVQEAVKQHPEALGSCMAQLQMMMLETLQSELLEMLKTACDENAIPLSEDGD